MDDYKDPFAAYAAPDAAPDKGGSDPFAKYTATEAPEKPYKYDPQDGDTKSGDTWKAIKSGAQSGVVGPVMAGGRYLAERNGAENLTTIFKNLGISSDEYAQENIDDMSPAARKAMQSAVTSPDFWEHPLRAAALKGANMSPGLAAMLVPSTLMGGPVGATLAVSVANGTLSAGQAAQEIYKKIDETSDEDLKSQVPFYAGLRDLGMSEKDAREKYNQKTQGDVPLFNLVVGGMAGAAGPVAGIARVAKGGAGVIGAAERGVMGRVGVGAAEGAGTNAVQGGAQEYSVQDALMEGGLQKKFDVQKFGDALAEQVLVGTVIGGPAGALSKGHPATKPKNEPKAAPKVEVVEAGVPSAEESAALAASSSPAPVEHKAPDVLPSEVTPAAEAQPTPQVPPDVAAASNRLAPERPTAEPSSDIIAQAGDLADPNHPRAGVFIPAAGVEHMEKLGHLTDTTKPNMVPNFDGEGGLLIARDPAAAKEAVDARAAGVDPKVIIGRMTGAGEGKPVEGAAVQQVDKAGNVTRERVAAPAEVGAVSQDFAHPERTVRVLSPEDALRRRAELVAQEKANLENRAPENVADASNRLARSSGEGEKPRTGRILEAQDDNAKAVKREAKVAQDAAKPQLTETGVAPKGKNRTKAELAKRETDAFVAKQIFDEYAPLDGTVPATAEARVALQDRVSAIVRAAEAAGIKISSIKGYEGTNDHMLYLREAADMKKTLDKKGTAPKRRDEHIMSFVGRERAAKSGDFSVMRSERKLEGELAKKRVKSAPEGTVVEDTTVKGVAAPTETSEVKLKTGKTETVERAAAASAVRKIELTPEERAKYEKPVAPKIAAIKERVAAAAKQVEKPTEAQAEAGNYKKGHVSIQGLDIAIENPRGSARTGVGADGKPWSVKMPDHYGYIKRTKGADGDHVDVYVGKHPDSNHVFVIDQNNHNTGKFDEHKAMIGYKDATSAMDAYERAFSDGKGFERIGLIKPMTMDEFKAWLAHGDTEKPVADKTAIPAMAHASDHAETISFKGGPVNPLHSTTVKEIVKGLDFSHLTGASEKLIPFLTGRLAAVTRDMPVHIVSPEEMVKFYGEGAKQGPLGVYVPDNVRGEKGDYIAISSDRLQHSDDVAHTLVHEMVHGATSRALHRNAENVATIRHLMNEVERSIINRYDGNMPRFAGYAFKNEHEFLAEAFSNPELQQVLAETPITTYLAERIGLGAKTKPTMWDYFVASVRKVLRGLGVPDGQFSGLEGVIKIGKRVMDDAQHRADPMDPSNVSAHMHMGDDVKESARDTYTNAGGKVRAIKDRLSSTIMLGERAEHTVLPGAAKVVEFKAMMEREKSKIFEKEGGTEIVRDLAAYEREHGNAAFNDMATLGFEASNSNVNLGKGANNDHLGKDAAHGWQAKKRLPDMQKRFDALNAEGQELLTRTAEFFKKIQNDISLQLVKNILHETGVEAPGLAERIHRDGVTEADKEMFKTNGVVNALNEAREIKELKGWYLPFRRYGDHVVNAYHEVKAPANGLKVAPDTVQFTHPSGSDAGARRLAQAYAENHELTHTGTKKVWVDKLDPSKIVEAEDVNAVPAYQVKLQRQSTEFFDTEAMARRVQEDMSANADAMGLEQVDGVRKRSDFVGKGADQLSGHMHTVMAALEKQDRFKAMSTAEKAAVRQTINEASVRVLGSTRLQSSFQQRRNVAGYSEDLGRVTADYTRAATGYLAKLRFQQRLDEAFKDLQKYTDAHKYESNDKTIRRDELMSELRKRVYDDPGSNSQTAFGRVTRRILQISRLDKLAGVSFHVINAQEPWTTSLPVIGGRHGFISAARTLGETYNLIGARAGVMAGLKDTVAAFRKDNGFADYLAMFKAEIDKSPAVGGIKAKRLSSVLDYGDARGIFSDEAIYEVSRYADPSKGTLLRGLDRADLMANQMGNAIEKINRTVTLLTAYELEFKKTANHEASMHYAYEVTHDTMGDYSGWNASPLFKGNAAMMALQFKKFAHKSYYLLGNTIRGTLKGDPEAARQFVGLMVTHGIVAGALGMPLLEPIKVAMMASNALGVSGFTYQDFETLLRIKTAEIAGTKGGEMIAHGIWRGLGVETSGRQGWDSLLTFGGPKDPSKVQDLKSWFFDTAAGATGSLMIDYIKMSQALMKGDFAKVAELAIPIKAASDLIKAGESASPQLDAKGKVIRPAASAYDMAVQALGFTPSSKAESYEKKAMIANATKDQSDTKSKLINDWVNAKGADKSKAFAAAQAWSATQPAAVRIKSSDLTAAASRRAKESDTGAVKKTKQNAHILDKLNPVFAP